METPPFEDRAPDSNRVTPYDEQHFVTYLRLLVAEAAGADWRVVARSVFALDPDRSNRRQIYESHLVRARWMTEKGYRQLLSYER
jgi:Uncharacterized conserved protein (DUF2285)